MSLQQPSFRRASEHDLELILQWLRQDHPKERDGSFWSNRNMIREGQRVGDLSVLAVEDGRSPIAFCLCSDACIDLFAVRRSARGQGLGTRLASEVIAEAVRRGLPGLWCDCWLSSSIMFWQSLGFAAVGTNSGIERVARPFQRVQRSSNVGNQVQVRISLLDRQQRLPVQSFQTSAEQLNDETYLLATTYAAYAASSFVAIRIELDGVTISENYVDALTESGVVQRYPWVTMSKLTLAHPEPMRSPSG